MAAVHRVKQFKDVTFRYQSASTVPIKVYVNGGTSPSRSLTLPAKTTPDSHTLALDVGGLLEGRLIRFRAEPTTVLILFSGVLRFRPYGEYFDGAQNEVWETLDLGLGI